MSDDPISGLPSCHPTSEEQVVMDADPTRARNTASRREALAKHLRKDEMLREQGSLRLHQNEISLHSCLLFDIDSQENVTFFIDANRNMVVLEEVDVRDTSSAKDDEWCRVGDRYYRRMLNPSYRERHRQWWGRADELGLRRVGWGCGIASVALIAVLWFVQH